MQIEPTGSGDIMRATTRPVIAALAAAALTLGACASTDTAPAALSAMDAPDSVPRPIADHDWAFYVEDGLASLAYGRAESDDVWLSLACDRGSGRLELFRPADADGQPIINLESGGETERFTGAPYFAPRRRLDETRAARNPVLRWTKPAPILKAAE